MVVDGILVVTIDNPPVNATSAEVRKGLAAAIHHASATAAIRATVLSGAGKIFIGGADIREFGKPPVEPTLPDVITIIESADKPVVAAINGPALGGGLEVALAAHARIASTSASFALPEVKLGIVPGAGGTQRLPRLIGPLAALDMIATGRQIAPDEAQQLGLIDRISSGDLVADAVELAKALVGTSLRRTGDLPVTAPDAATFEQAKAKILKKRAARPRPLKRQGSFNSRQRPRLPKVWLKNAQPSSVCATAKRQPPCGIFSLPNAPLEKSKAWRQNLWRFRPSALPGPA